MPAYFSAKNAERREVFFLIEELLVFFVLLGFDLFVYLVKGLLSKVLAPYSSAYNSS